MDSRAPVCVGTIVSLRQHKARGSPEAVLTGAEAGTAYPGPALTSRNRNNSWLEGTGSVEKQCIRLHADKHRVQSWGLYCCVPGCFVQWAEAGHLHALVQSLMASEGTQNHRITEVGKDL